MHERNQLGWFQEDFVEFVVETRKTIKEAEKAKTSEELQAVVVKLAKQLSIVAINMAEDVNADID
jgi:DNA-binding XRE family transcriptional regulator